jgi:hypothetical protein
MKNCDFVALGRQQFADPAFVNKAMTGKAKAIAPCLRCSCFNPLLTNPDERHIEPLWHRFVAVGDCVGARQVKQATYEGFCAAMDII